MAADITVLFAALGVRAHAHYRAHRSEHAHYYRELKKKNHLKVSHCIEIIFKSSQLFVKFTLRVSCLCNLSTMSWQKHLHFFVLCGVFLFGFFLSKRAPNMNFRLVNPHFNLKFETFNLL